MKLLKWKVVCYHSLAGERSYEYEITRTFTRWGAEQLARSLRYEARVDGNHYLKYEVLKV